MGCCLTQNTEKFQESIDQYSNIRPIEMKLEEEVATRVLNEFTPFSDRGDSSIKINRQRFVAVFSGDLSKFYRMEEEIGSGSYGRIYRAVHLPSGSYRAIKSINKSRLATYKQTQLHREVEILKQLDHPYVIKIFEVNENANFFNIVTELCTGGNLFGRILNFSYFSENMVATYMFQILSALCYCHKNNIVHRDLKPENILFENDSPNACLKVIDFGISTKIERNQRLNHFIGTVYYIAPEVINGNYNEKCDVWSCGVILYALLCGKAPFNGHTKKEILNKISKGIYTFQDPAWDKITKNAKSLIRSMLTKDPAQRPSAEEVLNHPWVQQRAFNLVEDNRVSKKVLRNLADFHGIWKIREATLHYIVCQMVTVNEVKNLRGIFISLDENGDGKISVEELYDGFDKLGLRDYYSIETILENCDGDKNGFIEYSEFLTATINWNKSLSLERLQMAFKAYDTDNNGKISLEEIKEFIGDDTIEDDVWEMIFQEADINKDGYIDIDEFKIVMSQTHSFN